MACGVVRAVNIEVALDTKDQTSDKVHKIVEALLRQNNVIECGIMARFSMTFAENPGGEQPMEASTELKKLGVASLMTTAG
jgi:hypothetical protein